MVVRGAEERDLAKLLGLYRYLHGNVMPELDGRVLEIWEKIMRDENHRILVAEEEGEIVSSCVLVIVPNLTNGQRPYGMIENVITHPEYRKRGFASGVLRRAVEIADAQGCYKVMLMTGSKEESTLRFYEAAGFNRRDKTAFIRWNK